MKMLYGSVLILIIAAAMTLGCVGCLNTAAPTLTPTPWPTTAPTPLPTVVDTPYPTYVTNSTIYMPQETTNGRGYPTGAPIVNASKIPNGGLAGGELGRQN